MFVSFHWHCIGDRFIISGCSCSNVFRTLLLAKIDSRLDEVGECHHVGVAVGVHETDGRDGHLVVAEDASVVHILVLVLGVGRHHQVGQPHLLRVMKCVVSTANILQDGVVVIFSF